MDACEDAAADGRAKEVPGLAAVCVQATDRDTGSGLNPHQVALALTFGVWGGASALVAGC